VLLARLPPFFPFPLFNYAFAVTDISFEIYMAATFIGVSPATLLDSYIGSLFSSLAALYGEDEAADCSETSETSPFATGNGTVNATLYPRELRCVAQETGLGAEQLWEMVIGAGLTLLVTAFLGWYAKVLIEKMADGDDTHARLTTDSASDAADSDAAVVAASAGSAPGSPGGAGLGIRGSMSVLEEAYDDLRAAVADVKAEQDVKHKAVAAGSVAAKAGRHLAMALPGSGLAARAGAVLAGDVDARGYGVDLHAARATASVAGDGGGAPAYNPGGDAYANYSDGVAPPSTRAADGPADSEPQGGGAAARVADGLSSAQAAPTAPTAGPGSFAPHPATPSPAPDDSRP
jgi:hypothetical protein